MGRRRRVPVLESEVPAEPKEPIVSPAPTPIPEPAKEQGFFLGSIIWIIFIILILFFIFGSFGFGYTVEKP